MDVGTREVGTFFENLFLLSRIKLITQALHLSFSRYSFASKHIQCEAQYYKWYEQIMGDGGVGDHFHGFLRGFPRFCASI